MNNPWDPSPDEIRQWAYTADAEEPCQDWDLALAWSCHEKALLECASDDGCPTRVRMLEVLYLVVGDAVRSGFRARARAVIEGFIERGDEYGHPSIRRWQERSRELIRHPERFDYDLWCGGGLARTP